MEHLDPVRQVPATVVQVGADPGGLQKRLAARYPKARLVVVDDCVAPLRQAVPPVPWLRRYRMPPAALCAHPAALPLASASADLLCGNLALGLLADPVAALRECRRVARHGALLMVSFLGPDSFRELREAWSKIDRHAHLHAYPDMHDVGDALVRAGFSDVVVDVERLHAEFDDVDHLLRELRTVGGGNVDCGRNRGLTTPRALHRLRDAYPATAPHEPIHATLEVGYAHAWAVDPPGVEVAPPGR